MPPPSKKLLKDLSILYVEDEPEIRESIRDFLRRRCDHVILAENGRVGLELYFEHRPDIVVTDINMPEMNGLEMSRRIKEDDKSAQIIVTTAHSDEELFIQSIETGINFYVLKPLNRERLVEAITRSAEVVRLAREVQLKNREIQLILDFQDNIVIVTNGDNIQACNKSFLDFLGFPSLDVFKEQYDCICDFFIKEESYIYKDEKSNWLQYIVENHQREHRVKMHSTVLQSDRIFVVKQKESPYGDGLHIVSFTDITEFERQKEALEKMAHTDVLTGVFNRQKFNTILDVEFSKYQRYQKPFCIIMFDIDHFKQVNDTYGHLIGDEVLIHLTTIIREHIRQSDLFARWGGEEFILLAYESDALQAQKLSEKLRRKIESESFPSSLGITCSFGVSEIREGDDVKSLVKRADEALYAAKHAGRNRVEISR